MDTFCKETHAFRILALYGNTFIRLQKIWQFDSNLLIFSQHYSPLFVYGQ